MTYAQLLLVFVVPLVALLATWLGLRRQLSWRLGLALGITSVLALVYTGPWDNMVVAQGVWSYPTERVLGATIGLSRVEEYAFFVLQVLLAGLLARALSPGKSGDPDRKKGA